MSRTNKERDRLKRRAEYQASKPKKQVKERDTYDFQHVNLCIHEAGHAVAILALGHGVKEMIYFNRSDEDAFEFTDFSTAYYHRTAMKDAGHVTPILNEDEDTPSYELVRIVAGPIAQAQFLKENGLLDDTTSTIVAGVAIGDIGDLLDMLKFEITSSELVEAEIKDTWAQHLAEALVRTVRHDLTADTILAAQIGEEAAQHFTGIFNFARSIIESQKKALHALAGALITATPDEHGNRRITSEQINTIWQRTAVTFAQVEPEDAQELTVAAVGGGTP